jgi:cbb3-type cytochrome oxidase maturation protein
MTGLLILLPVALFLGGLGLAAFLWSLRSGQFDDLDGAAVRILADEALALPRDRARAENRGTNDARSNLSEHALRRGS